MNNCELSDWEDITISTDSNNPTVMPYDGFIQKCQVGVNHDIQITVNGVLARSYIGGGDGSATTLDIPIAKGDRVYSNGLASSAKVRYYKKRDYLNR